MAGKTRGDGMDFESRVIERVRAEFVAKLMEASGYEDYSGCSTCGGPEGKAFTIQDVHDILNGLLAARACGERGDG